MSAPGGRAGLREATATFRQGEVVGLAGLEGSGQGVFLRIAAGPQRPTSGRLSFFGEDCTNWHHDIFRRRGVAFVLEGRLKEGLIAGLTLTEHFALAACAPRFRVPWHQARQVAEQKVQQFRIRGSAQTFVPTPFPGATSSACSFPSSLLTLRCSCWNSLRGVSMWPPRTGSGNICCAWPTPV
ncbi:ATP-binding cassette domain-containing protein [Desulfosoma sp.]|uniref:ATP-binding cassette domain-containing protein n=1 Tax=Desulfosoma sp. TaxID=2603217 RepID=UPI00404A3303